MEAFFYSMFLINCTDGRKELRLWSVQPQEGGTFFSMEPANVRWFISEACAQKRIGIAGWERIHVQKEINLRLLWQNTET